MPVEFTAPGYIEVRRAGVLVSRHRAEREAIESCSRAGPGTYVLTYPVATVVVTADAGAPAPVEVGAVNVAGELPR